MAEKEIQLTLNISTYEVPWNLQPDPATGYKTLHSPSNKGKRHFHFILFIYPVNNLQGHMKIFFFLLMNPKLDTGLHSCEV